MTNKQKNPTNNSPQYITTSFVSYWIEIIHPKTWKMANEFPAQTSMEHQKFIHNFQGADHLS